MIDFRDVSRNIESNALAATLRALPLEATLAQSLARAGTPQNQSLSNDNPDSPRTSPDGTPLILLRASSTPISQGSLAP